ncbi:hypothetical protein DM083_30295, partial [Klebsiella pneumoniae]
MLGRRGAEGGRWGGGGGERGGGGGGEGGGGGGRGGGGGAGRGGGGGPPPEPVARGQKKKDHPQPGRGIETKGAGNTDPAKKQGGDVPGAVHSPCGKRK